ncbi:MAG: pyridoxamine 5'-phosphate oxidase family protein [Desulfovibrio sp.]|jgi:uncharacterized pyridoxamine 5'-phosphate oxidase family protein|nr:pyridoxamine 5'-phosphate oxidase family protein [Desulfovibrio sp.]
MNQVLSFLQKNAVFYLATVNGDIPRVRPFGFVMEYAGKLYFCTGRHKEVYRQLTANPRFEIGVANAEGRWLRLSAKAVFDSDPALVERAFAAAPLLKEIYSGKNMQNFVLFYAADAQASLYDMLGNAEVLSVN